MHKALLIDAALPVLCFHLQRVGMKLGVRVLLSHNVTSYMSTQWSPVTHVGTSASYIYICYLVAAEQSRSFLFRLQPCPMPKCPGTPLDSALPVRKCRFSVQVRNTPYQPSFSPACVCSPSPICIFSQQPRGGISQNISRLYSATSTTSFIASSKQRLGLILYYHRLTYSLSCQ